MAVYQGARLHTGAPGAARTSARATRGTTVPLAGAGRVRPMGLLMAAIVATTMLGLVYLTQTLGTSAATSQIGTIEKQSSELLADITILELEAAKAAHPDKITPRARKQNLKRLDEVVVLPAP